MISCFYTFVFSCFYIFMLSNQFSTFRPQTGFVMCVKKCESGRCPRMWRCSGTPPGPHWQVSCADHVCRVCRGNGCNCLQVNIRTENQLKTCSFHSTCMNFLNLHTRADAKNRKEGPTGPNSHRLIRICSQTIRRGHIIKNMITIRSQGSFASRVPHLI